MKIDVSILKEPVFLIVLAFLSGVTSLYYVLAHLTGRKDLIAKANVELSEILNAIIVVAMTFLVYNLLFIYFQYVLGIDEDSLYSAIIMLLYRLQEIAGQVLVMMHHLSHAMEIISEIKAQAGLAGAYDVTIRVFPGFSMFKSALDLGSVAILAAFGGIHFQIYLYTAIQTFVYNFLLPFGILLRFIPGFRQFGNELIAASFAFGIIFPSFSLLFYKLAVQFYEEEFHEGLHQVESSSLMKAISDPISLYRYFLFGVQFFPIIGMWIGYGLFQIIGPVVGILSMIVFYYVGVILALSVALPTSALVFAITATKAIKNFLSDILV